MPNVNSFTETVNILVEQVNTALANVVQLNESITTQADTVSLSVQEIDPLTGDSSTVTYSLPSYNNILNKVNSLTQTMDTFVKGEGKVLLNDGTYREVKTIPVAIAPTKITNVSRPIKFYTRSNWFFESMMTPQLVVSFNLKNQIDDRSDRVVVKRVIFDNPTDEETQWFLDNIVTTDRTYYDTITYLTTQGKNYWEDNETLELPLSTTPYTGYFIITDKQTISGKEWFYIDTMNYGLTSDSPVIKNHQLAIGDLLRYANSIWKIDDIQINENRIHIIPNVGMDHPTINNSFEIYTIPFSTKELDIPVGYDECNIIFLKGINDDFNIIANDWSNSISFYSNYLIIDGGTQTLEDYYNSNVADFGRQFEGQAKEKFVPAFFGELPDAPIFAAENFQVKQINTQLNSTLDTNNIKNTQSQIESTKTLISSLRDTIHSQKVEMVSTLDEADRADLQNKIASNIKNLNLLTTQYQSLVKSLSTTAYENSAVIATPKYRIRGFFAMPLAKGIPPQEVIQFEISYRYLKLDNTGINLNSYTHADPSTGQTVRGVFTDWVSVLSKIREKTFDASTQTYTWASEDIANGDINNINQIDIPIQNGENVEIKIRSISEAGWPLNALKSNWSDTVIIKFPANLQSSDQVVNILSDSVTEQTTIQLDQTLSAAGVDVHLDDSIPNPNSGTGTYFKHQARNLAFDLKQKDSNGIITLVNTNDLQTQLESLPQYTYVTATKPPLASSTYPQITGTLQQFFQAIVNIDPSIYDEFQTIVAP